MASGSSRAKPVNAQSQGWHMTAIEHFEKRVGITQRAFDVATEKAALFALFLQDLERDFRDESKDLAVSVDTLLEVAKARLAEIERKHR